MVSGNTLYTHLHLRKDKFSMNKIIIIAQQIAQGMGYLHHRGIVHKDLKTKNIFLENGRAIITDFGLVNVARRFVATGEYSKSFSALTERYVLFLNSDKNMEKGEITCIYVNEYRFRNVQKTSKCLSEMSFQQPLQKEAFEIDFQKKQENPLIENYFIQGDANQNMPIQKTISV